MSESLPQHFDIENLLPELTTLALKLVVDETLAQDIVQDTFLQAIEQKLTSKADIIRICKETAQKTKASRRREPGTAMNIFQTGRSTTVKPHLLEAFDFQTEPEKIPPHDRIKRLAALAEKNYRGKYLSFATAKLLIKELQFHRREVYQQFVRQHKVPGMSTCPDFIYADQWLGWADYLGRGLYSFKELQKYVKETLLPQGIKTRRSYQAFPHPPGVPNNPDCVYREWRGWGKFFGIKRRNGNKRKARLLSYPKAQAYVRKNLAPKGINSLRKWSFHIDKIPEFLPSDPSGYYKGRGWKGGAAFFGRKDTVKWWPYEKSRKWVQKNLTGLGIDSSISWNAYVRGKFRKPRGKILPSLPNQIPRSPQNVYRNKGWRSWRYYFGTMNVSTKEKMVGTVWSYERAKSWIKKNLQGKLVNFTDWQRYILGLIPELPERPHNLLTYPREYYLRTGEWINWEDFLSPAAAPLLSAKRRSVSQKYLTYDQAKRYVKKHLKPKGIDTYRKYVYCKDIPPFLPVDPLAYYSSNERGWKGCTDFMGTPTKKRKSKLNGQNRNRGV